MNDVLIKQESPTFSSAIVIGILFAGASFSNVNAVPAQSRIQHGDADVVKIFESSHTLGQALSPLIHEQARDVGFEEQVMSFYAELLLDQETLGEEFEGVLHENLWELYSRD